ncbi:endonuclease I family protein [Neobacillus niacini]|uniref:endonuclease I family protein n=1 Tax=Neobacillus niacini TaxID=86668 RepID=UPI0021CB8329|nr:endonuclease [Neobacillus niacini]MCM3768700.1 endonuclease [Neobacillus niacini]
MSKKKKKAAKVSREKFVDLHRQLRFLKENKQKIRDNLEIYYSKKQDEIDILQYYRPISEAGPDGLSLFYQYSELLTKTHKNIIPYFISKDLYLYTWVDLHPDGSVKSIYSGERKNPETVILEDYESISQKYEKFQEFLRKIKDSEFESFKELKLYERSLKLNTEHIVPQSWFGAVEPMKGDLHHLFVCEPECNISRSNFPYEDFSFYNPESPNEPIHNYCGIAAGERFEPEYGKGAAARAMLYFLLRYPKAIKKSFRIEMDIPLLVRWHHEFPATLHEKHRNQAIYRIQGNRNPFIDFPDLVEKILFSIH